MKYTLKIDQISVYTEKNDMNNVAYRAIWTLTGEDVDGNTATSSASTTFPEPEGSFTPFEKLTEKMVIGWVEDCTDAAYMESRKEHIIKQIEDAKAPKIETPTLPWVIPEEVIEPIVEQTLGV